MTRDEILANKANLSGANLFWVSLSKANLSKAKGYIDLGTDTRGYHFRAIWFPDKETWQVTAGCRNFTLAEARAHWINNPEALARLSILDVYSNGR
jgi:uncharacterized protein YjbI with pentapeptide repeats